MRLRLVTSLLEFQRHVTGAPAIYVLPDARNLGNDMAQVLDGFEARQETPVVALCVEDEPEVTVQGPGFVANAMFRADRGTVAAQQRAPLVSDRAELGGRSVVVKRRRTVMDDLRQGSEVTDRQVLACRWFAVRAEAVMRAGSVKAIDLNAVRGGAAGDGHVLAAAMAVGQAKAELGLAWDLVVSDSLLGQVARMAFIDGMSLRQMAVQVAKAGQFRNDYKVVKGVVLVAVQLLDRATPAALDL
jgi:hypothetical protein